jgi:alpha-D-ribose 1-methylphosphonate 5-triphosphate synthase subunit PhnL
MKMQRVKISGLNKTFTLHAQGGVRLPVLNTINLTIDDGECVVIEGASGQGKSTLLKLIHANYKATSGKIELRRSNDEWIDLVSASEPELLSVRLHDIGYVSQFLRVIPRVSAVNVVAEPLLEKINNSLLSAEERAELTMNATQQAQVWLSRLHIPKKLWNLPPATFSGGEQQRINIARSMIRPRPLMLFDEPTASLDQKNADLVVELIIDLRKIGCAVLGIFHDEYIRERIATRRIELNSFRSL